MCGYLSDFSPSRRFTLLCGLVALILATILFGLARSTTVLIISRVLLGISTAIVHTTSLALLCDTVSRHELGKWMGITLSAQESGFVLGPLLGGVVYAQTGLWGVLGMLIAIIAVDILMRLAMIESAQTKPYIAVGDDTSVRPGHDGFARSRDIPDESSSLSSMADMSSQDIPRSAPFKERGIQASSYGTMNQVSSQASSDKALRQNKVHNTEVNVPTAPQSSSLFRSSPMYQLLANFRILTGLLGVFVHAIMLTAFDATLPLFLDRVFHWSSTGTGVIFLTLLIPGALGGVTGLLSDKFGVRLTTSIGCLMSAPPLVLMRLVTHDSKGQIVLLCSLLVLTGKSRLDQ